MMQRVLPDPNATLAFGRELAACARRGEVLALVGTLGAGKTTLCQGIAQGLGCDAVVTSPTFTLVHEYPGGRLPLHHLDFYRLEAVEELVGIGWDDILDVGGLVVVEWADRFPAALPPGTRWVVIDAPAEGSRIATVDDKWTEGRA